MKTCRFAEEDVNIFSVDEKKASNNNVKKIKGLATLLIHLLLSHDYLFYRTMITKADSTFSHQLTHSRKKKKNESAKRRKQKKKKK